MYCWQLGIKFTMVRIEYHMFSCCTTQLNMWACEITLVSSTRPLSYFFEECDLMTCELNEEPNWDLIGVFDFSSQYLEFFIFRFWFRFWIQFHPNTNEFNMEPNQNQNCVRTELIGLVLGSLIIIIFFWLLVLFFWVFGGFGPVLKPIVSLMLLSDKSICIKSSKSIHILTVF